MIIFDQLRISDDGKKMYINAHVNKARYFADVHLKKLTICTEDQVSETNPLDYADDYIYQENIEPSESESVLPVYSKPQILSEQQLLDKMDNYGGILLESTGLEDSETNYLSLVLSGKFSVLDTGYTPKLVVATGAYNPETDNLNNDEILFTIDGIHYEEKGHDTWRFQGKGEVKLNQIVHLYLYKQDTLGNYVFVRLDATDDYNFLHFLWNLYSIIPQSNKKELHLVLSSNDFNEKFTKTDLSHNMFFIYIECEGTPDSCVPCRLDEMTTLGVTFDYGAVFNPAMNITRELADTCKIPQHFLDFILNYDALKIAIETEHYVPAIGYWKRLVDIGSNGTAANGIPKPCGCHG